MSSLDSTDGYDRVNPPGVKNFSTDWRSGLAWCAILHAHRPELIDYDDCLTKSNAENLETAFTVAEGLGIPRLLDVEDVDVDMRCLGEKVYVTLGGAVSAGAHQVRVTSGVTSRNGNVGFE